MTQLSAGWGGIPPAPGERRGGELSAARRLLRRLVQLMAAPISPQERLDRMVGMIAADIVAEVCSAYVLRGGDSPVTVHLDGGELEVDVDESLHVDLTGWAVPVYTGELL